MKEFCVKVAAIIVFVMLGFMFGFTAGIWVVEPPEKAYERGREQGCVDIIKAYYRNQPYYKSILDSRMYEDTILMGWVVRQFLDSSLPDPEISIEDDTIAFHAWDSLGYCVLTGVHRDMAIRTISIKALKSLYRTSPMLIPDAWEHAKLYRCPYIAPTEDSADTMPAVDSVDTPWFWSDSVVMNDEHWICPNDEGWGFLPSCVLRDSLPDVCILRFPDMIIFWDTIPAVDSVDTTLYLSEPEIWHRLENKW